MSDINVGQISEVLNDKMDRDAHNVQSPSAVVIAKQDPTVANDYTWYRKYSDGWVEQGGQWTHTTGTLYLTLPIAMASNEFSVIGSFGKNYAAANNNNFVLFAYSTTQICLQDNNTGTMIWQVSGVAAN